MAQPTIGNEQVTALASAGNLRTIAVRATVDFASLGSNGGTDTQTASVPGAVVGDGVSIMNTVDPTNDMVVAGWVSAPDVVTLRATNDTPGTYDPPSQDFIIVVAQVT